MKIIKNSSSAIIVQITIIPKSVPKIIPVTFFPSLKGNQKQRKVNPSKTKLNMI